MSIVFRNVNLAIAEVPDILSDEIDLWGRLLIENVDDVRYGWRVLELSPFRFALDEIAAIRTERIRPIGKFHVANRPEIIQPPCDLLRCFPVNSDILGQKLPELLSGGFVSE